MVMGKEVARKLRSTKSRLLKLVGVNAPERLNGKCPSCGCKSKWAYYSTQVYPARYAELASFKQRLDEGAYRWIDDGNFGVDLYNCNGCGTTVTDTYHD